MVKNIWFSIIIGAGLLTSCVDEKKNIESTEFLEPTFVVDSTLAVIPYPMDVQFKEERFAVNKPINLVLEDVSNASFLESLIQMDFKIEENSPIQIRFQETDEGESYELEIHESEIFIKGGPAGILYGYQTLKQLVFQAKNSDGFIDAMIISDEPRFSHRGLLLDCSRHFFSVEKVKQYIDLLSLYKMNVLHWHLTEDQGWRIEIDAFPKLTEVGAWRIEEDGTRYGGYYTKNEIREIVKYAQERHVEIIPEIEFPGHSMAALAAYPEYSCTGGPFEVETRWGVFKEVYCAGNDNTLDFAKTVLDEVMDLFPSSFIHIGGDEVPKYRWEHCSKCQSRMEANHLYNEEDLQAWFISQLSDHLKEKGRQLIGWDEILEGRGLENPRIQVWRGNEFALEAAEKGLEVVMSPTSHCYLDYSISTIDLEKVYSFNPIPEDLKAEHYELIVGGEVNIWSERVPDDSVLDARVFPRLLAMSEVLWKGPGGNFEEFYERVSANYDFLQSLGVDQGPSAVGASIEFHVENQEVFAEVTPSLPDVRLEVDYNGTLVSAIDSIVMDSSGVLKVNSYYRGKIMGDTITRTFLKHNFLGGSMVVIPPPHPNYSAGGSGALLDGVLSSNSFRDGLSQGFQSPNLDIQLLCEEERQIDSIVFSFVQSNPSWIFYPEWIVIRDDQHVPCIEYKIEADRRDSKDSRMEVVIPMTGVWSDIYVEIRGLRKVPEWHDAAGADPWIFMDEIRFY